jgi:Flp pilus assembly protein TadD
MASRFRSLAAAACLSLLSACLSACGDAGPGRVIVIGVDGADPEVLDTFMAEGKLPHFATLRRDGAYGHLRSSKPMLSPILWTTIATGRAPADHGIGHFVAVNPKTGEQLPVTSQMRRVRAIWNILSDAGRRVGVVGWWATWPAETVNGFIVSDHTCYHFLFDEGATGDKNAVGLVSPPALQAEVAPLVRRPSDVGPAEAAPFVSVPAADFERDFSFDDDLSHWRWALATADSYRRIGLHLLEKERPDLLMVSIEGADSSSHLFGHLFRVEGLKGELATQQARYGKTVEQMYVYADQIIGDFMARMDDRTTLVVLSDHGFELGALPEDPSKTRDMRRVSERYHRMDGIIYLYGHGVQRGRRIDQATQLDVTPTVLTLLGVPPAADMPGRVLREALRDGEPGRELPARVATYETTPAPSADGQPGDAGVDPKVLERLEALGYLDSESPQGDRNMAAMLFEGGQFEKSAEAYTALVAAAPEDGGLRASLAGALASVGRYDEALGHLGEAIRLQPVNPEAHHNRGAIYERQKKPAEAIEEYRQALRYNPGYEPSQRALARLGATPADDGPKTPAEQLAAKMAERASEAARRGDYAEAMKALDEAERVAPRYARVQQYRANVAYLMGDYDAARAALEKALEIEPDNHLFRANLERLDEKQRAAPAE